MSALLATPALRLLMRLKLRGMLRRQARRMRTPKGLVLTLLGAGAFALWIGSLAFSLRHSTPSFTPEVGELRARAFGLVLCLLSMVGALTNRGLYLPRAEIERLFSAPVARAELVRYRLVAGGLRSLIGGLVLGLFGARRMPSPLLAFLAIVLAIQTLPVLNQFVAIALGALERRAANALRRASQVLFLVLVALFAALLFALGSGRDPAALPLVGEWLARVVDVEGELAAHPLFAALSAPFLPWAQAIAAPTWSAFLPWFALCLGLHLALVELCARLPIDFREVSLSTSTRAAARLARFQRGGGAAAMRASRGAVGWRVPWLFGRGPLGAVAWRKCVGLVRKARGALAVSLVALLFLTALASLLFADSPAERELGAPLLIATLGTIYLCSGLRFDFREELERMDVVRAWPLAPARTFLAMLLPEALLVAVLLAGTVLLEAGCAGRLSADVVGIVACLPPLVFAWIAGDNVVFLFAPVRAVPGQDGLVQNAGRRMLQMLLLGLLLGGLLALGGLAFVAAAYFAGALWAASEVARAAGLAALLAVLLAGDAALVWLGGVVLARFDVARDRG